MAWAWVRDREPEAVPMNPAELNRFYTAEIARYQAIAKSINLQAQ